MTRSGSEHRQRTEQCGVRLLPEERTTLERAAAERGMSLQDFLRDSALAVAAGATPSARARALSEHNPPRAIWFDAAGIMHFRCLIDDRNPDCPGCRETETPPGAHWRFSPPAPPSAGFEEMVSASEFIDRYYSPELIGPADDALWWRPPAPRS